MRDDARVPSVAVVGSGVMGGAISTRLIETGCRVAVFARRRRFRSSS
jgi:3-hydroxyisobutyrate dehydrogenase-like beta-hydroxyacid dehydrogenase